MMHVSKTAKDIDSFSQYFLHIIVPRAANDYLL
jgi:hypothetical protein